jgi:hypothetical protein
MFFWQWVVVLRMRVVRQFITIHCNPFKRLVPARISANRSLGQFALIDGVISSTRVWETLPTGVCLILPARFRVNTALEWVNPSPTHVWVNDEVISSARCHISTLFRSLTWNFTYYLLSLSHSMPTSI